ncbi:hypothetical protein DWV00_04025 [Trinickia dinghuensis]|uniref:Uncharacterized protein n=1 Tax=Trinickia dinghuensis TaxID=2291023 RepID=A0A3D8K5T2_9BURK|nr:hypothetical protein DWV00_04025 [Trinickia dinghuensis]
MTTTTLNKAKRPIAVYIISALCVFQYIGIILVIIKNPDAIRELVSTDSILGFLVKFSIPTILFFAGIFLFFMKRGSFYLFLAYLMLQFGKAVMHPFGFIPYLSLAMIIGAAVYCFRLKQSGQLS